MPYRVYVKENGKRRKRVYADELYHNGMLRLDNEAKATEAALKMLDQCAFYYKTGAVAYPDEAEVLTLENGFFAAEPIKIVL